ARIRRALGVELPLRRIFETPDVASLARVCETLVEPASAVADTIPPVDRTQPLPVSFAQERLWFLNRLEPDNPFYNVAVALELRGALDATALARALSAIAARHEVLRTT